jgi:hypothetical protein
MLTEVHCRGINLPEVKGTAVRTQGLHPLNKLEPSAEGVKKERKMSLETGSVL